VRSAVGVVENHCTGLEARFNGEAAHAAAGLSREQADEIVKQAVAEYAPVIAGKPVGLPFAEGYDPVTLRPRPEWLAVYDRVKERVAGWGLPLC
jgi:methylamine---corrinoid protein Co-methyltransferase